MCSFYIIFEPYCLSFGSLGSSSCCLIEIWFFFVFIVGYNDVLAGNKLLHCNNSSVSFLVLAICSMTDAADFLDGTNLGTSLGTSTELQHANFFGFLCKIVEFDMQVVTCICNIICFFHAQHYSLFPSKSLIQQDLVQCWVFSVPSLNSFRSSYTEELLRKSVLKICSKFTEEHPCWSVISLWHARSPVNLLHSFRATFPRNTSGWLLLFFVSSIQQQGLSKKSFELFTKFLIVKIIGESSK